VNPVIKKFQYGGHEVTMEIGEIARQTSAAIKISIGDTMVLVSAVGKKDVKPGQDFFPLTVNYQERTYAAGKIPGGFFKREGRPSESETLVCRLIDRPIRPLFPKAFKNEVQVIPTVMSLDPEIQADIVAMLGASAALACSGMPFMGPIGAARVGYINGSYVLNPTKTQLAAEVGTPAWDWTAPAKDESLAAKVAAQAEAGLSEAYSTADKMERQDKVSAVKDAAVAALVTDDDNSPKASDVIGEVSAIEKKLVRSRILAGERRIDGRDTRTVRPITVKTGILPRVHGSSLFTRGETQAIVAVTLGTTRDAQIIDAIDGERRDAFMLHYNFPPYCVGETGFVGSPKRREIGHGKLAKRGVQAVMPDEESFPYTVRVVSEITESNGSSSMASVCGSSLAMMDAGVPLTAPVAGIAMGLIKDENRFAVLSDILGDEDHLGDMDFKVAGSENGVTALQMDIKIDGITAEIMEAALEQAKEGRLFILGEMNKVLGSPREELSEHAPRFITVKIHPEKIAAVIGKGGAVIRALTEETGATIDIGDDGVIKIASSDRVAGEEAKRRIEQITADVEVGTIYEGKVQKIMDFGAFVKNGLTISPFFLSLTK